MSDLLTLESVVAGYGESVVLDQVSFSLGAGQTMALLGRNGTGKTTLIQTLVGLTRLHSGAIWCQQQPLHALPLHRRVQAGLGWVPQERNIFKSLTVWENLTAVARPGPWTPERVLQLFPRLGERLRNMGHQLSGGEQQILAIARMLRTGARTLMLDEPTEGLAPIMVAQIGSIIAHLKRRGYSLLLVEQNLQWIAPLADYFYVLEQGCVVDEFPSHAFEARVPGLVERLGL